MSESLRKRAKHTRSKLGCRVCRIRRIRCDNTRPACSKCTNTGRKCEWYDKDPPPLWLIRNGPPAHPAVDPLENRFLDFFRTNTAHHLSGYCADEFWDRTVLQIGDHEPCIRYGLVALGSLHEAFQDEHFSDSRLFPHETPFGRFSWLYYTKTIELLNMHILLESWNGVEVALLGCILCVSFEWLRGCYVTAETHLRSGLAVLRQWLRDGRLSGRTSSSTPSNQMLMRSRIAPIFSRLARQARTFVATPVPCTALLVSENLFRPPPNLKRARDELYGLLGQSYTYADLRDPSTFSIALRERRQAILSRQLNLWYDFHVVAFAITTPDSVCLLISYTMITIMVGTSLSADQMQYDCFNAQFRLIVDLAEVLPSIGDSQSQPPVPIEVLPVLYYVALKCRHPITRRRAISLMTYCRRREGLWDAYATARITKEVVDIEEEGLSSVVNASDVIASARVSRLFSWSHLDRRSSSIKFKRQGNHNWAGSRVVEW